MRKILWAVLIGLISAFCFGPWLLLAQQGPPSPGRPQNVTEWSAYAIPRQPYGHSVQVSGTPAILLRRATSTYTNEADAWLVPWEALLTIQTPSTICACLTLEDEPARVTMGSGTTCGEMQEDGGTPTTGQGVCWRVSAPGRSIRVSRNFFGTLAMNSRSRPGYADSYCSAIGDTTRDPYGGGNQGAPCRLANDCVPAAGIDAGCTQAPESIRGTYVLLAAAELDGGVVSVSVEIEN